MIELSFWRGFPPMLASFLVGALVVQLDLGMVARLGEGALAGYGLIARVAIVDVALTAAVGAISLIVVSHAQQGGTHRKLFIEIWICVALLGFATAAFGALAYPFLIDLLAEQGPAAQFAHSAIFIHVSGAPLRMIVSATSFALFSLGRGGLVLSWTICEAAIKAALNVLLIWSFGFVGCFVATLLVSILSVFWALIVIRRIVPTRGENPPAGFRLSFIRGSMIESTRGLAPQLAVFASFALFALSGSDSAGVQRLDAYAAVQGFILLVLAPLLAATRFFAMRFSGRAPAEVRRLLSGLLLWGAPFLLVVTGALAFGRDLLGAALYGDLGPWWSSFALALALSLPLRYAGALLRGALLSRGRIGAVAAADSVAPWLVALPLIALGLFLNQPAIACLSLLAPEGACLLWFWRRHPLADEKSARFASDLQLS
ncbi:MAG: methanobactin export MATE transporter MbnM [Methylocystis sp.]